MLFVPSFKRNQLRTAFIAATDVLEEGNRCQILFEAARSGVGPLESSGDYGS